MTLLLVCTAANAQTWDWDNQPGKSLAWKRGETILWRFNYGPEEPKPHFHPVAMPDGTVVTWDRPPDHVWHHALWFSWKFINGVNYWEPDPATGKAQGLTEWAEVVPATQPDGAAQIALSLTYRTPGSDPVMTEKRRVDISSPRSEGVYHFDWTCTFTAGNKDVELSRTPLEGEPGGQPWGGYAGLSVRLAKDLTDRAAETTEGPVEFNDQSRFRGKATALDYHGIIDGRAVGLAICDHPENLNHPTPWYVIRSATMSYFSPAVICFGPHTLKAGKSMTLRYRVIVHPGSWDSDRLRREYQRFVQKTPADSRNSIFAKDNLVAWCIVPFDAGRRGPDQRAEMLSRLGMKRLAYDWRDEHIPTFEDEILAMREHGIEFLVFWSPMSSNPGYEAMVKLIEKHKITPQIWMVPPATKARNQEEMVEQNAKATLPFVNRAKELGCKFALYNHGGWAGEPDNLVAMVQWLRAHADADHVGIVYNFHHGHEHLDRFPQAFDRMTPYLWCVNLNGMTRGGPKILPLGQGREDLPMLKMIRDSGYRGPIGILDHRGDVDAEESLKENLTGLKELLQQLGDDKALRTFGES